VSTTSRATDAAARLFAEKAGACATGIFSVSSGRLRRLFCLENGRLVFAASNLIEEQFAESLVRERLLSPTHRNAARVEARKLGVKLTAYLHEHKVVAPDRLLAALERHVGEMLESALLDPAGEASFSDGRPDLDGELRVDLGAAALLLRHANRHPPSVDDVRMGIGPPDAKPRRAKSAEQVLRNVPIDEATRRLLEASDGTRTVSELALGGGSAESEETRLRALYGLVLLGAVSAQSAAQTVDSDGPNTITRDEVLGRMRMAESADCYGVLGVERSSDAAGVRDAYYYLARRYHPDRFRAGELRDLVLQVESYFAKVTEAYNTLSDAERRAAYDHEQRADAPKKTDTTTDAATLARQNFAQARMLIAKKRFHDAVTFLQNAVQLDDSSAEYHIELGDLLGRNPRHRANAEKQLLRAIELDPSAPRAYFTLGELYVRMSRGDDAIRLFEEVLRWDPAHAAAREQLEGLSGSKRRRGGIFGG